MSFTLTQDTSLTRDRRTTAREDYVYETSTQQTYQTGSEAGLGGRRRVLSPDTRIAAAAIQASSLVRTRAFGSTSTLLQTVQQATSLVRNRVMTDSGVLWTSGVYVRLDLPGIPIQVQDYGDPSKWVVQVLSSGAGTFKGGLSAGSIDIPATGTTGFHVDTSGNIGVGGTSSTTGNFTASAAGVVTAKSLSIDAKNASTVALKVDNTVGLVTANLQEWYYAGNLVAWLVGAGTFGALHYTAFKSPTDTQPSAILAAGSLTHPELRMGPGGSTAYNAVIVRHVGANRFGLGGDAVGPAIDIQDTTIGNPTAPTGSQVVLYNTGGVLKWRDAAGTVYDLSATGGGGFSGDVTGSFSLSGDISPTSLSADQNDYNPTGLATASTIRQDTTGNFTITGLQGGTDGKILYLWNIATGAGVSITLTDSDALSTVANRFLCPNGVDCIIGPKGGVILQYDSTSSRWRVFPIHSLSNATPQVLAATGASGVASNGARTDHVHPWTGLAALSVANTFTVSPQTITINSAGNVGLQLNLAAGQTARAIQVTDSDGVQSFALAGSGADVLITQYAAIPQVTGRRAEGTNLLPTAVAADSVGQGFGFRGYNGSAFVTQDKAQIALTAAELWTTTAQGTYIDFYTTKKLGVTRSANWRLTDDAALRIKEAVPPASPASGFGSLYWNSTDSRPHAQDDGGVDNPLTGDAVATDPGIYTIRSGEQLLRYRRGYTSGVERVTILGTGRGLVHELASIGGGGRS